jgi:hypothetical protein
MIGFIAPYTFTQFGTTGNYSAIAILHIYLFTVAHALGFSVFTSRFLATDLSQSHCKFKPHVKSSWQSNSFLAISSQSPWTTISRTRPKSLPATVLYSIILCFCFYFYCQSQSHFTTGGLQPISLSWRQIP